MICYGQNLMMKKIDNLFEKYIEKIIVIFLFLNPILDVIAAVSINYFNISLTLSSIVRIIFMLLCLYYLLFLNKTDNNKRNKVFSILFIFYLILFIISTLIYKDVNALSYEIKNTLNTFYFPIVLIAFIDMFKQYDIKISLKQILYVYLIYLVFIIIPDITNTGFLSYSHSKVGNVGWFLSANAVGNILSFLLPIVAYVLMEYKNNIINIFIALIILYVFSSMGTKVPVLSLLIFIAINFIYFFIKWIKDKKYNNVFISLIVLVLLSLSSIMVLPKTSFYKNIQIHKNFLGIDNYLEVFTDYKLVDHFIFSQRLTFLNNTNKNYQKASLSEKLVGIGYIENYATDKVSTKTIEIDYFEIFYRNGILGFILYIIIVINPFIEVVKKLKTKSYLNLQFKISILLILLLALFSGHVFVTPMVSIFVAVLFAIINTEKRLSKN